MGGKATTLRPEVLADLEETTAFTADEIRQYYKRFMHECADGRMSVCLDKFKKIYKDVFPDGDANKFAEYVFRTMDQDENGRIDFRELLSVISIQLRGRTDEKLEWTFELYDIDGTGYITKDELLEMIKSIHNLRRGNLPNKKRYPPQTMVDHIFDIGDKDGDHKLSKAEFIQAAKTSSTLQRLLTSAMAAGSTPFAD